MPKQIITTIYEFHELTEDAKEKARNWYRELDSFDNWWEGTYTDASMIGLKLTGFDLDRNKHATGIIETSAPEVAESIIANHGVECKTYIIAKEYQTALNIIGVACDTDGAERQEWEDKREEIDDLFLNKLLSAYADMLQEESYYRYTPEYVDEQIKANDYTFTIDGKRLG